MKAVACTMMICIIIGSIVGGCGLSMAETADAAAADGLRVIALEGDLAIRVPTAWTEISGDDPNTTIWYTGVGDAFQAVTVRAAANESTDAQGAAIRMAQEVGSEAEAQKLGEHSAWLVRFTQMETPYSAWFISGADDGSYKLVMAAGDEAILYVADALEINEIDQEEGL